jgi:hypothetical protein
MTPKEIYDRKKRLATERKLRNEEAAMMESNKDLEAEILVAAAVVALERIGAALERISESKGPVVTRKVEFCPQCGAPGFRESVALGLVWWSCTKGPCASWGVPVKQNEQSDG